MSTDWRRLLPCPFSFEKIPTQQRRAASNFQVEDGRCATHTHILLCWPSGKIPYPFFIPLWRRRESSTYVMSTFSSFLLLLLLLFVCAIGVWDLFLSGMDDGGREGSCVFNSKEEEEQQHSNYWICWAQKTITRFPQLTLITRAAAHTMCCTFLFIWLITNEFCFFWGGIWVTLEDAGTQLGAVVVVVVPFAILRWHNTTKMIVTSSKKKLLTWKKVNKMI